MYLCARRITEAVEEARYVLEVSPVPEAVPNLSPDARYTFDSFAGLYAAVLAADPDFFAGTEAGKFAIEVGKAGNTYCRKITPEIARSLGFDLELLD